MNEGYRIIHHLQYAVILTDQKTCRYIIALQDTEDYPLVFLDQDSNENKVYLEYVTMKNNRTSNSYNGGVLSIQGVGSVATLNHKEGNCVDHSHLLVAMFRTAGLNARYVHGTCRFSDGDVTGHVWTQVKIGNSWVCADAISYRNSLGKIKNWDTNSYSLHSRYSSLPF